MDIKNLLYVCMLDLSGSCVGRDNVYKFFLPNQVKTTAKGAAGVDLTDKQAEELSDAYVKYFVTEAAPN